MNSASHYSDQSCCAGWRQSRILWLVQKFGWFHAKGCRDAFNDLERWVPDTSLQFADIAVGKSRIVSEILDGQPPATSYTTYVLTEPFRQLHTAKAAGFLQLEPVTIVTNMAAA